MGCEYDKRYAEVRKQRRKDRKARHELPPEETLELKAAYHRWLRRLRVNDKS